MFQTPLPITSKFFATAGKKPQIFYLSQRHQPKAMGKIPKCNKQKQTQILIYVNFIPKQDLFDTTEDSTKSPPKNVQKRNRKLQPSETEGCGN